MFMLQENLVKLVELQRDLVGIDNLVQPGREFLREGCLQKLSRKGYQQRMFFLVRNTVVAREGSVGEGMCCVPLLCACFIKILYMTVIRLKVQDLCFITVICFKQL